MIGGMITAPALSMLVIPTEFGLLERRRLRRHLRAAAPETT